MMALQIIGAVGLENAAFATSDLVVNSGSGNVPNLYTYSPGPTGNVDLTYDNVVVVGQQGTGTFYHNEGILRTRDAFTLGATAGSAGTYWLDQFYGSGPDAVVVPQSRTFIGLQGTGTLKNKYGTFDASGATSAVEIGALPGSVGTVNLQPSVKFTVAFKAAQEIIGESGTGIFNQDHGLHTVSGLIGLGLNSGGDGTYNMNTNIYPVGTVTPGDFLANGGIWIGGAGRGTFNQGGGTFDARASSAPSIIGQSAGSVGAVNIRADFSMRTNSSWPIKARAHSTFLTAKSRCRAKSSATGIPGVSPRAAAPIKSAMPSTSAMAPAATAPTT
jgi:hypothetical protein